MVFFMGVVYYLCNCGKEDFVYLCGGEYFNIEIVDFL